MATKYFENEAHHSFWSVHVEAWQRSGLSRRRYCRDHGLSKEVFARWLRHLIDMKALKLRDELRRREAREHRGKRHFPSSTDKRCKAVQAFWAMHVEAMTWSGLSIRAYAKAHGLSKYSLRRWRNLIEANAVEIDWRAQLHPSARAKISSGLSSAAKGFPQENSLTDTPEADPESDRRANRRRFTDDEKLAIALESERPGVSVAEVCRRHGIVTSMVFRWRVQFGFAQRKRTKLATVTLSDQATGSLPAPLVLHDLLPPPAGMIAVELPDGRCVFASAESNPDDVRKHIADQEDGSC